ncbi:hypothetical protein AVEN_255584-1 [Araneus ventricosus]|uniref:Uncharacterized protein n=1 Tax=Araneus ventricosus TaxID=182803 RepID=A0A4Y2UVR7_ARAVE|nr:hypothetical protein AVEN_255584-1 [Araneus ventricosus]
MTSFSRRLGHHDIGVWTFENFRTSHSSTMDRTYGTALAAKVSGPISLRFLLGEVAKRLHLRASPSSYISRTEDTHNSNRGSSRLQTCSQKFGTNLTTA